MMLLALFNTARLAKLIEGGLATAGGFLVGYVAVMILGVIVDRFIFKRPSPAFLHRVGRLIGGLIVAILVAMMVFGGGGGDGDGTGDGTGSGKSSPTTSTPDPTVTTTQPKPAQVKPQPPAEERIQVQMLGGSDVKDQRFYLVEGDATPRTFEEAKAAIEKKKAATTKTLGLDVRFTPQNTLPREHPAVLRLTRWATETAGLTVTFPAETP